jgi:hypothetical protein
MGYGRMTAATLQEQLDEAQRLMRESAENRRRTEPVSAPPAPAVTSAKLDELTK